VNKVRAAVSNNKRLEIKDGEALVKILALGVCGSDVHVWRGWIPAFSPL
jgi:threonine dehydrogenase-like Zn-dependent dehydrogenase